MAYVGGDPSKPQPVGIPMASRFRGRLVPRVNYRAEEVIMGYLFILVPMLIFITCFFGGMIFDCWISFQRW